MAVFNNILAGAAGASAGAGGYQIERSLRFNDDDSPRLSFTPSSSGDLNTWTWSGWVKRSNLTGDVQMLMSAGITSNDTELLYFDSDDTIKYLVVAGGSVFIDFETTAKFVDLSAWYHIVAARDGTTFNVYVNGVSQSFQSSTTAGGDMFFNRHVYNGSNVEHVIGARVDTGYTYEFDGYLADIHFIDGQALGPTDFGEFDDNGVWQPIEYTGTYGTNGFHLDFSDNSSAAALGYDAAGNNDWTVNNISVTAGAGNDSLFDSPQNGTQTDTGAGGEVSGNYCTMNPLEADSSFALSNGNLDLSVSTSWRSALGTFAIDTGKWYYEFQLSSGKAQVGICGNGTTRLDTYIQNDPTAYIVQTNNFGTFYTGSSGSVNTNFSWGAGDIVQIAYDGDNNKIWVGKNNTWYGDPSAGTGEISSSAGPGSTGRAMVPVVSLESSSGVINFGQRPFTYTAPTGFKALCTASLDDPTIADGLTAMDVVTYTGNGSTKTVSGLNFSPDLVWIKVRSSNGSNRVYDVIRGVYNHLYPDRTNAESSTSNALSAFNSDGFDVSGNGNETNASGTEYVAWTWDAGTSTVSNTNGSITSQVRANPSAGFSVVKYTGQSGGGSWGHGLNVAPEFIIFKRYTDSQNWFVWIRESDGTYLEFEGLNNTRAAYSSRNNVSATSTTITLTTFAEFNSDPGSNYIAYCFAPVDGYSSFGSYVGNGSSDGPMVFTNFRPRWIMIKETSNTGDWEIFDTSRDIDNIAHNVLLANDSAAEIDLSNRELDILSNGFKIRSTASNVNTSNETYIYAAFAERPFKYARAR